MREPPKCEYCGAPVTMWHKYAATFECGTKADEDGVERSEECIAREAAEAAGGDDG